MASPFVGDFCCRCNPAFYVSNGKGLAETIPVIDAYVNVVGIVLDRILLSEEQDLLACLLDRLETAHLGYVRSLPWAWLCSCRCYIS